MDDKESITQAKTLPEGWMWGCWDDGSGSLTSPEGKSYFGFDLQTNEYQHPGIKGNNWVFFQGYPYECESYLEFEKRAEKWIIENIIEKDDKDAK